MRSSRLVLPWSTWPMTVTMGARSTSWSGVVLLVEGDLGGRRGDRLAPPSRGPRRDGPPRPRSRAPPVTSAAVSRSMVWLMVAKMPLRMSSRMTSAELMPMSSASSLTVMESGISTAPRVAGSATLTGLSPPSVHLRGFLGPRRPRVPLRLRAIGASQHHLRSPAAGRDWARSRVTLLQSGLQVIRQRGRAARAAAPIAAGPGPSRRHPHTGRRRAPRAVHRGRARHGHPAGARSAPGRPCRGASGRRHRSVLERVAPRRPRLPATAAPPPLPQLPCRGRAPARRRAPGRGRALGRARGGLGSGSGSRLGRAGSGRGRAHGSGTGCGSGAGAATTCGGLAAASSSGRGPFSERMSMRQPVSLAARRAF